MTATEQYTRMHNALALVAADEGLRPFEVRVLVALHEAGGSLRSDELVARLADGKGGSQVRRSLGPLYARVYATGGGSDGGPRRPGTLSQITLSGRGIGVARRVLNARMAA